MKTADSTRTHSLFMAKGASAVPKTVSVAPAIQKISVVVCGAVLAKKIKPIMASIFKKIEVAEMSSFTLSILSQSLPGPIRREQVLELGRQANESNGCLRNSRSDKGSVVRASFITLTVWGGRNSQRFFEARQLLRTPYNLFSHLI
jgi:hypothetical protein